MFDILLNSQIAALPVAFLAMLVAGAKLYRVTRRKSAAIFSIGMACLLLSQAVLFVSYHLWPAVYEHATGIVQSEPRNIAFLVSASLSILGLAIASISLLYFAWVGVLAQPTVQRDGPAFGGSAR